MATIDQAALRRRMGTRRGLGRACRAALLGRGAAGGGGDRALWLWRPLVRRGPLQRGGLRARRRAAGRETGQIVVATGIANVYARDPTAMHDAGMTIAAAYPRPLRARHGRRPPAARAGAGSRLRAPGGGHAPGPRRHGARGGAPPPPPEPLPIVLAALRRRMLELTRDRAPGAPSLPRHSRAHGPGAGRAGHRPAPRSPSRR